MVSVSQVLCLWKFFLWACEKSTVSHLWYLKFRMRIHPTMCAFSLYNELEWSDLWWMIKIKSTHPPPQISDGSRSWDSENENFVSSVSRRSSPSREIWNPLLLSLTQRSTCASCYNSSKYCYDYESLVLFCLKSPENYFDVLRAVNVRCATNPLQGNLALRKKRQHFKFVSHRHRVVDLGPRFHRLIDRK